MSASRLCAHAASAIRTGAFARTFVATVLSGLILGISGCAPTPPFPIAANDPSNPAARVPPTAYRSTIQPYTSLRPAEPLSWREQNERLMPQQKQ
jgi:hypothetical protein